MDFPDRRNAANPTLGGLALVVAVVGTAAIGPAAAMFGVDLGPAPTTAASGRSRPFPAIGSGESGLTTVSPACPSCAAVPTLPGPKGLMQFEPATFSLGQMSVMSSAATQRCAPPP
jgi:hypothetical protein